MRPGAPARSMAQSTRMNVIPTAAGDDHFGAMGTLRSRMLTTRAPREKREMKMPSATPLPVG